MVNFCQWVHPFYPLFNWWIRIRIRNTDPDPQSCWIGTDPIWIWIHNTAINKLNQNELEFFVVKLFCLCLVGVGYDQLPGYWEWLALAAGHHGRTGRLPDCHPPLLPRVTQVSPPGQRRRDGRHQRYRVSKQRRRDAVDPATKGKEFQIKTKRWIPPTKVLCFKQRRRYGPRHQRFKVSDSKKYSSSIGSGTINSDSENIIGFFVFRFATLLFYILL